ncbi:unnamed protein product [Scytosiphon promiscuus]
MGLFQVVCLGALAAVARAQEIQNCSVDTTFLAVGSTEDAADLATSLECSNGNFLVEWDGEVVLAQTLRVTNGTSLNITATGPGAIANGHNTAQLFVVDRGSRLHLSNMTLAHGNATADGGAIYAEWSNILLSGGTSFISNSAVANGGAIYASDSNVSWDGDGNTFSHNSAGVDGGAIFSYYSASSWDGDDADFSNNSAGSHGGALHLRHSTISWDGDGTGFGNNHADDDAGAIFLYSSSMSWDGNSAEFSSNSAGDDGGAIHASGANVSWDGDGNTFSHNSAGVDGGAIYLDYSSLHWVGDGTNFSNNFADNYGGAIFSYYSAASWNGDDADFSNNSAGSHGGAFHLRHSTVSWDGDGTGFGNNHADDNAGAIFLYSSSMSWDGDSAEFSSNSAGGDGGAIFAFDSTISWDGNDIVFSNNSAGDDGGAMYLEYSALYWSGDDAEFIHNQASIDGGAIYSNHSRVSWDGEGAKFVSNYAGHDGGAVYLYRSNVSWDGDGAMFSNNYASHGGGAIRATNSEVSWDGDGAEFSNNYANFSGGAIRGTGSKVAWDGGGAEFSNNYAGEKGGAIQLYDSSLSWKGDDTNFSVNYAESDGGAIFAASGSAVSWDGPTGFHSNSNSASGAGGAIAMYAGTDHQPATFSGCNFSDNTSEGAGGAVEILSGKQEFISCHFEGNSADVGGAMRLGGDALVRDCSFLSNSASTRGLAIAVIWFANISGSWFDGNDLYCAADSYRQDTEEEGDTERFEAVCLDCPSWDECSGCSITKGNVTPACVAPLDHTSADEPGAVLETLNITQGYWRSTSKSYQIVACFNADACSGGQTGADDYCTPGYKGPYCAVCETGYAPSSGNTCTRCSSSTRQGLMVVTVIAALVVVSVIVAIVKFLLSTEREERNIGWFHRRVLPAVPVQALKIIVVPWQILTQFAGAANVTYPGVYQDFLSVVDVVNFDLGSVVAAGCLWSSVDFHVRLLISTLGPLASVGFLAMTYRIAVHKHGGVGNTAVLERIRHKHQTALLLLTFLVYSSVSSMVFQTFACETLDDGIEYLRGDYRIYCTDATHKAFEVYAGFMMIVYPVGIPLLYAILLYQHRHVLSDAGADKTTAQPISDLWEPYKPERFYYEVVECGRRIMLTGVVVFIFPNDAAQIAITILISFVFFAVFELLSPYKSESEMWLARGGHVIVFFSMFDLLLLKVDVSRERDQSQAVFAGALVAGHVLMALTIVVEAIGICYASRRRRVADEAEPSESLPGVKPRAGSDDDDSVFEGAPKSWGSFMRQISMWEEEGPARNRVSGAVVGIGRQGRL